MECIISGGRKFNEPEILYPVMDYFVKEYNITKIISGGALGADTIARFYAKEKNIDFKEYKITKEEWDRLGKAAGPIRNRQMLDENNIGIVIGFKGWRGTPDMLDYATSKRVIAFHVTNENKIINWLTKDVIGEINDD